MARVIKLLCVNDAHVREFRDTGIDRNGDPTSNRQALMRVLDKVTKVDGVEVATFLLAEPPTEPCREGDDFDRKVLSRGPGKWLTADPDWLAIRKTRTDERAAKAGVHEAHAQQAQAQQVTGALIDFARSVNGQPARSPAAPKSAKGGA